MTKKYLYSRKEIEKAMCDQPNSIFGAALKAMLLSTVPEKKCEHLIINVECPRTSEFGWCNKCGKHIKLIQSIPPELPRKEEKKIEKVNFWKGHLEQQLDQMWEKQCEIIDLLNSHQLEIERLKEKK